MSDVFRIIPGGKPDNDPAQTLYEAIHSIIGETAISPIALLGVLELVKHDVLTDLVEG
jgi:hypothetical protein